MASGAGCKGIAVCAATRVSAHGGYPTEMVEPCGALPRKCLFICLFGSRSVTINQRQEILTSRKGEVGADSQCGVPKPDPVPFPRPDWASPADQNP
jgi:hypothetical protein